jgi:hypothetical protein
VDFEVIVVNDGLSNDGTEEVCEEYKNRNLKYIFSGHRNIDSINSRNPAIPNNIAFKQSSGDIIFLTCPEMYHLNNSIEISLSGLSDNVMVIPKCIILDQDNIVASYLQNNYKDICEVSKFVNKNNLPIPNDRIEEMPFFVGMKRDIFEYIGGYDEDFTGYAGEDNDLVNRLQLCNMKYKRVDAKIIHLWHGKNSGSLTINNIPLEIKEKWQYNYNLLLKRQGIIIRNVGREWGKI